MNLRPEINTIKSVVSLKLNNLLTNPAYQRGSWVVTLLPVSNNVINALPGTPQANHLIETFRILELCPLEAMGPEEP